jgi:hypothetical protein
MDTPDNNSIRALGSPAIINRNPPQSDDVRELSPDEAQAAAEQVLYPRLWKIADPRQLVWIDEFADDSDEE